MNLIDIVKSLEDKGYIVYKEPYKLNVVGIRSAELTSKYFDDKIAFFWYDDKGNLVGKICPATTDPSVDYLRKGGFGDTKGTAILKAGQYVDTYKIDYHAGKYLALCQRLKPVTVIRDKDRDDLLNFFADTSTGMFGINIHRSSYGKRDELIIGPDSAGCQVFQKPEDFLEMMRAAEVSRAKYGNKFTYTLIDQRDVYKTIRNVSLLGIGLVLVAAGGYIFYRKFSK